VTLKFDLLSTTIAVVIFLIFITQYNIGLASDVSKAYWMLISGILFFAASIVYRSANVIIRKSAEGTALLATLMVASLLLFSLPIQISAMSLLPGKTVSRLNVTEGNITGPRAVLKIEMVNAGLLLTGWDQSGYRILTELSSRAITEEGAEKILDKVGLVTEQSGENITIYLTGPERAQQRTRGNMVLMMPHDMLLTLSISLTNGTVEFTNLTCGKVETWVGSGRVRSRSLDAWTAEMTVDNGPIDLEIGARKIDLRTLQGDIVLVSLRPETDCTVDTVGGRIDARLNYSDDVAYRIEANSIGGTIYVNLTGVAFTKQRSGYVLARTKDYRNKRYNSTIVTRTTTGNVTIQQI